MASRFLYIVACTLFALYSTARAQTNLLQTNFTTNWNPQGEGCVDSAGFLSCYASQASTANTCVDTCSANNKKGTPTYNTCVNSCDQLWYAANIGCWLQSCWNQVYSCGYQLAAMYYFDGMGLAQNSAVPFYPPPVDASAGACSCNLGYVYGNISAVSTSMQGSNCQVIAGTDNTTLYNCECCELSWPISNILQACPKANLDIIGLSTFISETDKTLAPSADKCAILANGSETCIQEYNFPWVGTKAYNPLALPTGEPGVGALTNNDGIDKRVVPTASVTVLTLLSSYTSTITHAASATTASANHLSIIGTSLTGLPSTASTTSKGTATSTSSATTSSAATSSTTKKSSGTKMDGNRLYPLLAGGLLVVGAL